MVAPKGPGHLVRRPNQEGRGVPALIAISRPEAKQAKKVALAWAKGMAARARGDRDELQGRNRDGSLRRTSRALRGASATVTAGYDTLVAAGYQPEMAYFECLHELEADRRPDVRAGISGMRFSISDTASMATW